MVLVVVGDARDPGARDEEHRVEVPALELAGAPRDLGHVGLGEGQAKRRLAKIV